MTSGRVKKPHNGSLTTSHLCCRPRPGSGSWSCWSSSTPAPSPWSTTTSRTGSPSSYVSNLTVYFRVSVCLCVSAALELLFFYKYFRLCWICLPRDVCVWDGHPHVRPGPRHLLLLRLQPVRLHRDHRLHRGGGLGQPQGQGRLIRTLRPQSSQTATSFQSHKVSFHYFR